MKTLCDALRVTRQGYYAWKSRGPSAHDLGDAELARAIADEFEKSRGTYGAPRIHAMLKRRGIRVSRKRVARLMRENGVVGVSKRKKRPKAKARQEKTREGRTEDLVKRSFKADGPNRFWYADITYVRTHQGWLYLAVVFDIWSRKIVGWSMDDNMRAKLVDDALRMGIARRRPDRGLCHHSDHGSQYASLLLGKTMESFGITPSMGSISSPWDNAPTESLMSTIKAECTDVRVFETREQAKLEIFDYIETFYNRIRIHSALGMLSPDEFEAAAIKKKQAA